jgi:hypothetical protein
MSLDIKGIVQKALVVALNKGIQKAVAESTLTPHNLKITATGPENAHYDGEKP